MQRSDAVFVESQATTRPRLGIIGGGQLAKMTAAAAAQLGCQVAVLERQEDFPARGLATHAVIGDWDNPRDLLRLAPLADVLTVENEFVDPAALAVLGQNHHPLWPSAATLARVQDKLRQKTLFAEAGLPVPRFADAPERDAVRQFGFPAVLKKRRHSYDGKGNATVRAPEELEAAWSKLDGDRHPLYVEAFCPFERELAIIVTRGQDGAVVCYPVVETINRDHICHVVKAPAEVSAATAARVTELAVRAVTALEGVGSFGLEFFCLADGSVLLNEIAPRVHNTGHYTIEACVCSQFENHVRAVLGWPLGAAALRAPAAVMINLLGHGDGPGAPRGLAQALRVPGAHIHIYGKTRSARGRKMGHVTALGATLEEALATARAAADCIRFGGIP
ncbi:MAG: 5-(carboxyamino)imidazole ribonucleotide synthase [Verrucomicrobiales bacterium]|nr:5-(carboxyamino)imidazole ribonucleotide synthase [Verrucomicrobiales bacterium]